MIACVSPGYSSANHTINTLRYSDRLKEKTMMMMNKNKDKVHENNFIIKINNNNNNISNNVINEVIEPKKFQSDGVNYNDFEVKIKYFKKVGG